MVSLRRRRLLGLCCGPNGYVTPLPLLTAEEMISGIPNQNARAAHKNPDPTETLKHPKERTASREGYSFASQRTLAKVDSVSPSDSGSTSPKGPQSLSIPDQPIKRRKRHRRKQVQNQEPCLMRGVYFKNMKWQAAIKVDKKQIHLGTVSSQEEAAHLYDRAAFMCGREPNFELAEEEKKDLKRLSWDEFLAFTRRAITNKKSKRRIDLVSGKTSGSAAETGKIDDKNSADYMSCSDEAEGSDPLSL